jgi:hypothetical protein
MNDDELRELLADLVHEIWIHWMSHMFSQLEEDDLGMVIQWDDYRRWKRQMKTNYHNLTEREKASDRKQANKIIAFLDANWSSIS